MFFHFIQFLSLENLSDLDLALSRVKGLTSGAEYRTGLVESNVVISFHKKKMRTWSPEVLKSVHGNKNREIT